LLNGACSVNSRQLRILKRIAMRTMRKTATTTTTTTTMMMMGRKRMTRKRSVV
jgi:hypothetical protein